MNLRHTKDVINGTSAFLFAALDIKRQSRGNALAKNMEIQDKGWLVVYGC